MQMTVGEIKRSYDQARNKTRQIGILADLNNCDREKIEKILGVESKRRQKNEEPIKEYSLSETMDMLYLHLEDIEEQIKSLEEEYRKLTIAIEVLGKVRTDYGKNETA